MKRLVIIAAIILLWLQYTLWFGQSGHFEQTRLSQQLAEREDRVQTVKEQNQLLMAEVLALDSDVNALEAHARQDLGMIKKGEVFYLVPRDD